MAAVLDDEWAGFEPVLSNGGRPLYADPEGGVYSEKSVTFPTPDGRWVNAPSVMEGGRIVENEDELREIYEANGYRDPLTGRELNMFATVDEAVAAAKARSASLVDDKDKDEWAGFEPVEADWTGVVESSARLGKHMLFEGAGAGQRALGEAAVTGGMRALERADQIEDEPTWQGPTAGYQRFARGMLPQSGAGLSALRDRSIRQIEQGLEHSEQGAQVATQARREQEAERLAVPTDDQGTTLFGLVDGSLKSNVRDAGASAVGFMGPSLAAGMVAGPVVGLGTLFAQSTATKYDQLRAEGASAEEATSRAYYNGFTETLPETLPFGILFKKGMPYVKRVIASTFAEGASEIVTQVSQEAEEYYHKNPEATWGEVAEYLSSPEVLRKYAKAGFQGALMGGPMGAVTGGVDGMRGGSAETSDQANDADTLYERMAEKGRQRADQKAQPNAAQSDVGQATAGEPVQTLADQWRETYGEDGPPTPHPYELGQGGGMQPALPEQGHPDIRRPEPAAGLGEFADATSEPGVYTRAPGRGAVQGLSTTPLDATLEDQEGVVFDLSKVDTTLGVDAEPAPDRDRVYGLSTTPIEEQSAPAIGLGALGAGESDARARAVQQAAGAAVDQRLAMQQAAAMGAPQPVPAAPPGPLPGPQVDELGAPEEIEAAPAPFPEPIDEAEEIPWEAAEQIEATTPEWAPPPQPAPVPEAEELPAEEVEVVGLGDMAPDPVPAPEELPIERVRAAPAPFPEPIEEATEVFPEDVETIEAAPAPYAEPIDEAVELEPDEEIEITGLPDEALQAAIDTPREASNEDLSRGLRHLDQVAMAERRRAWAGQPVDQALLDTVQRQMFALRAEQQRRSSTPSRAESAPQQASAPSAASDRTDGGPPAGAAGAVRTVGDRARAKVETEDELLVAMAKLGGLNSAEAESEGVDPVVWQGEPVKKQVTDKKTGATKWVTRRRRTNHWQIYNAFSKDGMTADDMIIALHEAGFGRFAPGPNNYDRALLFEAIDDALAGKPVHQEAYLESDAYIGRMVEARMEAEAQPLAEDAYDLDTTDPEVAELITAAERAFAEGVTPEQSERMLDGLVDTPWDDVAEEFNNAAQQARESDEGAGGGREGAASPQPRARSDAVGRREGPADSSREGEARTESGPALDLTPPAAGLGDLTKPASRPAQTQADIFGTNPTAQALSDRERARQRAMDTAPDMDKGEGALFSDANRQVDIEDAAPGAETSSDESWFSGSKVVDSDGSALTVFHGQPSDVAFDKFKVGGGRSFGGFNNIGHWFTADRQQAKAFSVHWSADGKTRRAGNVYGAYLAIKSPWELWGNKGFDQLQRRFEERTGVKVQDATPEAVEQFREYLRNSNKDGVIIRGITNDTFSSDASPLQDYYLALDDEQIRIVEAPGKERAPGAEAATSAPLESFDAEDMAVARRDTKGAPTTVQDYLHESAMGVVVGARTAVDRHMDEVAAAYQRTREHLRKKYGDTLQLYRLDAPETDQITDKQTLNYTVKNRMDEWREFYGETDPPRAERSDQIPVDDIVAVHVRGDYLEVVAKNPDMLKPGAMSEVETAEARAALVGAGVPDGVMFVGNSPLQRGKYRAEAAGQGSNWADSPRQAAEELAELVTGKVRAAEAAKRRADTMALVRDRLLGGGEVNVGDLQFLGLKKRSDIKWFFPAAAELFGISSRAVRPIIKDLIRTSRTDMGSKRESVDAIKALNAIARHQAAHQAATSPKNDLPEPTEAQKEAGNYQKGHVSIQGLDISIENPAGSKRNPDWPTLKHHYGYIRRSQGRDGDHVDVFIGPEADSAKAVYIVDQVNPETGYFDEHKVMLGFPSRAAAREAYLANYAPGWKGVGAITRMPMDRFKAWLGDPAKTRRPVAKGVSLGEPADVILDRSAPDPTRDQPVYYVSTGEKSRMYTLRTKYVDYIGVFGGRGKEARGIVRDYHVMNLGTDFEGALEKARNYLKKGDRLYASQFDLEAIKRGQPQPDPVLKFGKHKGESIHDLAENDPDYVRWLQGQAGWLKRSHPNLIADLNAALEGMGLETIEDAARTAQAEADAKANAEAQGRADAAAATKWISDVLDAQAEFSGFAADMALQLERGKAWSEFTPNQQAAMRKVWAKATSDNARVNSSQYKDAVAEFDRRLDEMQPLADAVDVDSINWTMPRWAKNRSRRTLVDLPVAAIEQDFALDEPAYVGEGGTGNAIGERYQSFDRFIRSDPSREVDAIEIGLDASGVISFQDGRHRFAWVRDHGGTTIKALVDDGEVKAVQARVAELGKQGQAAEKIADFGEKIGGARKDTAVSTGPKPKTGNEGRGWRARYKVGQFGEGEKIGVSNQDVAGKWYIEDTRKKRGWPYIMDAGNVRVFDTEAEAERAVALYEVSRTHSVGPKNNSYTSPDEWEIRRKVTDRKRVAVKGGFATRDEAMRYMAENPEEIIEIKTAFGGEARINTPDPNRSGTDWRQGRPATGQMFMDTFGFRGVEFGNWNNQAERQLLLDHAYDALSDLADLLGVPPRALSLNGDLALAFGARGHGKGSGAAHYEPGRGVINLTKMQGAGALAHEWMHALDHYFARQDGKAKQPTRNDAGELVFPSQSSKAHTYQSHGESLRDSGMREALRERWRDLLQTMFSKSVEYVEDTTAVAKVSARTEKQLEDALDDIRKELAAQKDPKYWKRHNQPATAEQMARFESLADALRRGEGMERIYVAPPKGARRSALGRESTETLEGISQILKKVRNRAGWDSRDQLGPMDYLLRSYRSHADAVARVTEAEAETAKTRRAATDFLSEAKEIDRGRVSDYWSTEHEMMARAFEAYIQDRVATSENASDFLAYGTTPADNALLKMMTGGKPYPEGQERQAINAAFDAFWQEAKTHTDDSGRVALFASEQTVPQSYARPGSGAVLRDIKQAVARTLLDYESAPDVQVVQSVSDLPQAVQDQIGEGQKIMGVYWRGQVYLVADNLRNGAHARKILAHEVVGHLSLEEMLGAEGMAELTRRIGLLKDAGDARVLDLAERVAVSHGQLDAADEAAEIMALIAEERVDEPALRAVLRWLREQLRTFLRAAGLHTTYSPTDLDILISRAGARLRRGAPAGTGGTAVARFKSAVQVMRGGESMRRYGLNPKKRYTVRQVAEALEARQHRILGEPIAPTDYSADAEARIARWMGEELRFELESNALEDTGVGWYSAKFQNALDSLAARFPEFTGTLDKSLPGLARLRHSQDARDFFTAVLAITSDGQKARDNFRHAARLYAQFRDTGTLPTAPAEVTFGNDRNTSIRINLANINRLMDEGGPSVFRGDLLEQSSVRAMRAQARVAGEKWDTPYEGHVELPMAALIFGPKLGAFYANLMGEQGYLTMDRWWSRTFNRYRGTLLPSVSGLADDPVDSKGRPKGLQRYKQIIGNPDLSDEAALELVRIDRQSYEAKGFKKPTEREKAANTIWKAHRLEISDAPLTAGERSFMLRVANRARYNLKRATGRDITIADLQAILWYYEKKLYGQLGARDSGVVSYEDIARQVAQEGRGAAAERRGQPDADPGREAREDGDDAGPSLNVEETREEEVDRARFAAAYHGTPHTWAPEPGFPHGRPRYDASTALTGEGAQAYGAGFYVAENKAIAQGYQQQLAEGNGKLIVGGLEIAWQDAVPDSPEYIAAYQAAAFGVADGRRDLREMVEAAQESAREASPSWRERANQRLQTLKGALALLETDGARYVEPKGNLYGMEVPDDAVEQMLDWDRLMKDQPPSVREALKEAIDVSPEVEATDWNSGSTPARLARYLDATMQMTGKDMYLALANAYGSQEMASAALHAVGIPGIKYLDAGSRGQGKTNGTRNFVLFRPQDYITDVARFAAAQRTLANPPTVAGVPLPPGTAVPTGATPGRNYTQDQLDALQNIDPYVRPRTLAERIGITRENVREWLIQGAIDQFRPLRRLGERAWMLARLTRAVSGAIEASFTKGRVFVDADGAIDINPDEQSLIDVLAPLGDEMYDFLAWIVGNRAESLAADGRENLFDPRMRQGLMGLNQGQMADGRDRASVYEQARLDLKAWQAAHLDIAEQAGIIDPAERAIWNEDFYVPFYRLMPTPDGGTRGPMSLSDAGLVGQTAFRRLKGGTEPLGDPLTNLLLNANHLLQASMNNRAANEALELAISQGVAQAVLTEDQLRAMAQHHGVQVLGRLGVPIQGTRAQVVAALKQAGVLPMDYDETLDPNGRDVVWTRRAGERHYYHVNDHLVMTAITALNYDGLNNPAMKGIRAFKRVFTQGVTAAPEFRIANLIRDSLQAVATSELSMWAPGNIAQGFAQLGFWTEKNSALRARMLASGAEMHFGQFYNSGEPDVARNLIARSMRKAGFDNVLDSPNALQQFVTGPLRRGLDWWEEFGSRVENVNRAALYEQLRAKGASHLEASFAARDLMDFSQHGAWLGIRFLTQAVPFLNARVQGMDKLGRSAVNQNQRGKFWAVTGLVTLASMLLYAAQHDEDWYRQREEWDRDTYWAFRIPGTDTIIRVPKPFEVGAMATIGERILQQVIDDEAHGKLFAERVVHILGEQLNLFAMPQFVAPALEVWANRDPFRGTSIESPYMRNLSPDRRRKHWTSETAIGLAKAYNTIAWKDVELSPIQVEYLINGYFGWAGRTALDISDAIYRGGANLAGVGVAKPDWRIEDHPVIGRFVRDIDPPRGTRYEETYYDWLQEVRTLYADLQDMRKLKEYDDARAFRQDAGKRLAYRKSLERTSRELSKLRQATVKIHVHPTMGGSEKRRRLDELERRRQAILERAYRRAGAAFTGRPREAFLRQAS